MQIHTRASSCNISGYKDRFFRFSLSIPELGYSFPTLTLTSFRMNACGLLRKKRNLLKEIHIYIHLHAPLTVYFHTYFDDSLDTRQAMSILSSGLDLFKSTKAPKVFGKRFDLNNGHADFMDKAKLL